VTPSSGLSWNRASISAVLSRIAKVALTIGLFLWVGGGDLMAAASVPLGLAIFLGTATLVLGEMRAGGPGAFELRDDGVMFHHGRAQTLLKPENVANAFVIPSFGTRGASVQVRHTNGNTLFAEMPDDVTARAVVERLGFGPRGRPATIAIGDEELSSFKRFYAAITAAGAGALPPVVVILALSGFGVSGSVAAFAALSVYVVSTILFHRRAKRQLRAPTITAGRDGVQLTQRVRVDHVPRAEIARVHSPAAGWIIVERLDGSKVEISAPIYRPELVAAAIASAAERLGDQRVPEKAAAFERGVEDIAAWRTKLRRALDGGYREASFTVDDAMHVLEAPGATNEQRVGAALALRVAGEPPQRIRVAAGDAVDPELRAAFEAIAEDEDASLERAMAKLSRRR
jgi:hypothetical protein